jgi:uncharacterized membrane protein
MIPFREWVELAAQGLEILAVVLMISFIAVGTTLGLIRYLRSTDRVYGKYRLVLGQTLQVGLEILVAADIIHTVSTPLTVNNLLLLSGLVLVRTFLGWSLTVELEGRWPWQKAAEPASAVQPGRQT